MRTPHAASAIASDVCYNRALYIGRNAFLCMAWRAPRSRHRLSVRCHLFARGWTSHRLRAFSALGAARGDLGADLFQRRLTVIAILLRIVGVEHNAASCQLPLCVLVTHLRRCSSCRAELRCNMTEHAVTGVGVARMVGMPAVAERQNLRRCHMPQYGTRRRAPSIAMTR